MTVKASAWARLPEELRALPQWAVAGASKAPMGIGPDGKLRNVSVNRPSEWMSFDAACALAWENRELVTTHITSEGLTITQVGLDIGFIICESDPLTCIDLDVKDATTHPAKPELWTTPDDFQFYTNIVHHYDTYTERSKSGKGLHIWALGSIGRGFKRNGVEVYSQERFIICTGDVWIDKPVQDREIMLRNMVSQMRPAEKLIRLEEVDPDADDWYVLDIAARAANSDKFLALWNGKWQELGYPSQSEADLSLMSMLCFYSESNSQCRRMFRDSALGKREKAQKNDRYLNFTLSTIRERQEREQAVEFGAMMKAAQDMQASAAAEIQRLQGGVPAAVAPLTVFGAQPTRVVTPLTVPSAGAPVEVAPPVDSVLAQMAPVSASAAAAGEEGIPWPPGFLGAIARFFYGNSFLPIKEVSIVSALGLMAGVTGKVWHIPQSGLNLYIVLVARSAIGKEAMHTSISTLISHAVKKNVFAGNFVDFTEYASGPALLKACLANQSFVNVSGEWGRRMKRMAMEDGRDGPLMTLRTQMTNLYQKSGPQSIAGGVGYSSTESNIASVTGVAYSMIGETTPGTFYESLTESMMEDGFLSRFLIVGYDGDRPEENEEILTTPDEGLLFHFNGIAKMAHDNALSGQSMPVGRTEEAAAIIAAFTKEANGNIRKTDDEARRQMWNRAMLKALRIAAICAVSTNPMFPVIGVEDIEWAIQLVRRDIAMMQRRLDSGDVGSGDITRQRKLMTLIKEYRDRAGDLPKSYKVDPKMRAHAIVPRHYLQMRTQQVAAFYSHKFGHAKALEETLKQCIDNGHLMEVKPDKLASDFNHHGKAYRILEIPDYQAMSEK